MRNQCIQQPCSETGPDRERYSAPGPCTHLLRKSLTLFLLSLMIQFTASCASAPSKEDMSKAEMHYKIAGSYLNKNQLNEAYIEFQKSLKFYPRNKETLNYLGYISSRFRNYDEAVDYYKKAIAIDDEYSEAINNLGVVYAEREQWDEAIDCFTRTLDNPLHSTPAWTYSNLGYAYYRKGMYTKATASLEEGLVRNPVFPRARYILGLIQSETGNEDAAIEEYKRAIGIQPDYMDAHWALAGSYMKKGMNAKALKHLKLVAESDTDVERSREASRYIRELSY